MGRSSILYFVVTTLYVVTITQGLDNKNVVVSNGEECAAIGMSMFKKGGGAVDAMIATLFCEGVTGAQSNGLGGGFVATVFAKEKKGGKREVRTLVAREQAPKKSNSTMFVGKKVTGVLAVAIPGELKGYQALHNEYGLLKWDELIAPTIALCEKGYPVNKFLRASLEDKQDIIENEPTLSEIFCNSDSKKIKNIGEMITRPTLKETLKTISSEGADTMYKKGGKIAEALAAEIAGLGGILTIDDLVKYTVEWKTPINTTLQKGGENYVLYSAPLPASGAILALILNMVNGYKDPSESVEYYHHIAESYKFAYGARSQLGSNDNLGVTFSGKEYADKLRKEIDPDKTFTSSKHYYAAYPDIKDHGTANIVVLAANGDAIAATTTINTLFGAKLRSKSTGIILNDEMDDFSVPETINSYGVPASEANFIAPGKRPVSSMCPTIVLNKDGDVVYVAGAAGGSTITTTVASIFIKHFWLGKSLHDAVEASRYHHQLTPMELQTEDNFSTTLEEGLRAKGHTCTKISLMKGFSAATTISRLDGTVQAEFEPRRSGSKEIA